MAPMSVKQEVAKLDQVDPDLYCAAWAVVLVRHAGIDDACEVVFKSQSSALLRLTFSVQLEAGDFLHHVGQELKTLSAPISTLESNTELPVVTLKTAVGEQHTAISTAVGSITQVKLLFAHFHQAVHQLRSLPQSTRLGVIDIACIEDRQQVLRWNEAPPPRIDETLCSLFADQVRQRPSAIAVASWDGELLYSELDELSAKLAGEIVRRAVSPQQTIALCFDKSLLAVVAMLAVLRARGAFVNLGIALPHQRQSAILKASGAVLLIVDSNNASRLEDHQTVPGLLVDIDSVTALPIPTQPLPHVFPGDAAAITFTSGSTGAPKGIVVEHGSIATSCDAMTSRLDLGPHSRVLQFASFTFDAAVGDTFYALSRGATVCIPSERERVDDLAGAARRLDVNWAFLTPSVLSLLEPRDIPSLRRLLVGGEKPDPKHIALWAQYVSLHLVMGPAECAIYCAASEAVQPGQDTSTFGRAAGCRLWVVDENDHSKLAPVGCPGELVVEGRIVARGYLNDPKRSVASFLGPKDVPWLPPQHENRLYKSGDLVRFNVDYGTFSFVARKDTQVKLHGQRVELSEIEIQLKNTIPGVESALVVLNTSAEHANRHPLVSFLVFARTSAAVEDATGQTLWLTPCGTNMLRKARDQLAAVLPTYMVPTLYVPVTHVPFTANGKRDTVRLRDIAQNLSQDELHAFSLSQRSEIATRPLSQPEKQLRELWALILRVETSDLGPNSDFIREGGDSLMAMHLVSAAEKQGLHLQVATILMHPRLSDMALEVTSPQTLAQDTTPAPFTLLPGPIDDIKNYCATACAMDVDQIEDIYPTAPIQNQLWAGSQRRLGTYILQITYQLPSPVRLETFRSAWDQVIRSADILRTRLVSRPDTGLLQVVSKTFEWDTFDSEEDFKKRDHYATMNLNSPLARLAIISPAQSPIFVFVAHHLLYDAFMLNMIFVRITDICMTGNTSALFPYKNFVSYVQRLPTGPSMAFWKAALDGCPTPSWPPAAPPNIKTTKHIRHHIAISVRPTEFTIATFAQAAFTLLFASHTQANDVVFAMTFSGRDADIPSILDTAGPTLYTVPFRMKTPSNGTLRTFLNSVRGYIRDSAPFGHIGLPAIAKASPDAARALDIRCVFSVQPSHVVAPEEVFGPRTSFREEMGRLPLIFEVFVVPGGVDVSAEFNTGSLGGEEVQRFVEKFGRVLGRLFSMELDALVGGEELYE
ncbi:acetyl-CoA synthetase-like protein [Bimuria novae-zelandiae CBS 107.79]|uniref:Acetyl-CoA synthetase-like protein n=1 Tax=Bimuria novae-zelandiae CBS 107.79 TaxID=1447943 RepID=A0A6A5UXG9_9PLEO|nr:acetyl-CoA synthetase-like protein [Bimuria novae-zelandiae CBS 107.79]